MYILAVIVEEKVYFWKKFSYNAKFFEENNGMR